ncbi:hypothetical protein GLOTRDRAFT_109691 [Gloeophyllum trabeum ATCC 11539]|uniref:Alpha/beta-hydrolase n=1 Tax=Gloeophyllum trabeum (strain ATCC 11539 / FP-39264 / Madison 617) TaxID=670483 RepID=S7S141_GLOTA|nr:uncharacterized protein GLOTRDRAFT_109691 [Gloeophyllum trabeum ATCC 11539]EPQ59444.1 hypothetical protein GLOTRDRAFT_109691 [Gloeophyllum trabeum ATCC 11539]
MDSRPPCDLAGQLDPRMSQEASDVVRDPSEVALAARKRDVSFYLVLVFAVGPIWSIVPLSWAYVVYNLWSGRVWFLSWHEAAAFGAAVCEAFFSIYYYQLSRYVSGPSPLPAGNLVELQAAFSRVLQAGLASLPEDGFDEETLEDERPGSPAEALTKLEYSDPRAIDFRNCLRIWFGKAPWSQIHTQEVYAWLYWSIFNEALPPLDSLSPAQRAALDDALNMIEMRTGSTIPRGSNPDIKPILLTLDPVNVSFRPLVWYLFVTAANYSIRKWCQYGWGAQFGRYKNMEYMVRVPEGWSPATGPHPIVFLHGLGLGLTQYKLFLTHLHETFPDRPLLVPLQPQISQDIFHPRFLKPMGRHEMADTLAELLKSLNWVRDVSNEDSDSEKETSDEERSKGITLLSHSNGSYVHGWMLKSHPEMVYRSCFVDPVTFCSWEGDVCYNFLYRPCSNGLELIMRYFVGTELGVANLLQRHFDWSSNSLWYEEIPNARDPARTMFLLGGKDAIVNAERVKRYLRSHGIRKGLWYDPKGRHGQALLAGGEGHAEILRWLRQ